MKKIFIFLTSLFLFFSFTSRALALDLPSPIGYVNDFASILSSETKSQLESELSAFEKETSHEIAVATVESLQETTIEDFAEQLFSKWRIGKKNYDNGVLLLIAPNEREIRIEVGYGLEGALPDITAKEIIDNAITPEFKEENYDQGVINGIEDIKRVIIGEVLNYPEESKNGFGWAVGLWFFIFFGYFFYVIFAILGGSKKWWPGGVILGGGGTVFALVAGIAILTAIFIIIPLAFFGFLMDYLFSKYKWGKIFREKGAGRKGWWIGGGSGRSGGGFGGFGGGSSGGGGASGSW